VWDIQSTEENTVNHAEAAQSFYNSIGAGETPAQAHETVCVEFNNQLAEYIDAGFPADELRKAHEAWFNADLDTLTLTPADYVWAMKCYQDSRDVCDIEGWTYEGEDVMTSIGYVEIQSDGAVLRYFGGVPVRITHVG
jgi:hypothetical protein